jgi:hypothetical protein
MQYHLRVRIKVKYQRKSTLYNGMGMLGIKIKHYHVRHETASYRASLNFNSRLGGLMVSVLVTGPKIRWLKLGRGQWICKGDKIFSKISFGE